MLAADASINTGSKVQQSSQMFSRPKMRTLTLEHYGLPALRTYTRLNPPEMVDPDGGRSIPPSVNSGTQPSSMLKMLSVMDASTTCAEQLANDLG